MPTVKVGTYGNRAVASGHADFGLVVSGKIEEVSPKVHGSIEENGQLLKSKIYAPGGEKTIRYSGTLLKAFLPPNLALQDAKPKEGIEAISGGGKNEIGTSSLDMGGDEVTASPTDFPEDRNNNTNNNNDGSDGVNAPFSKPARIGGNIGKPQPATPTVEQGFTTGQDFLPDKINNKNNNKNNVVDNPADNSDNNLGITATPKEDNATESSSGGASKGVILIVIVAAYFLLK
jgi:hypothetical protein